MDAVATTKAPLPTKSPKRKATKNSDYSSDYVRTDDSTPNPIQGMDKQFFEWEVRGMRIGVSGF